MTEMLTYRRLVSKWWWVHKRTYFVFVMRELSSIFIAWLVVYLLILVSAVSRGEAAYETFQGFAEHPVVIIVNAVAVVFVAIHTITWFGLTPKAMDARLRGRPVPDSAVIASQYVGLVAVSAIIFWLVTR
jgi:fumarate reductase subunit C